MFLIKLPDLHGINGLIVTIIHNYEFFLNDENNIDQLFV